MEFTREQQDAIDARGENLLVSAAAGSGKTAVLTARVAKLVKEGTGLENMLIITFTNAAAAEMKQRIGKEVPLSVLEKYSICTFDKFAIDVYKSYYHVLGLPPDLKICDEYKKNMLQTEALEEMFEELFEAEDKAFLDFLDHYGSARSNDAVQDMIRSFYTFLQSMPDPQSWLDKAKTSAFDPKELMAQASQDAAQTLDQVLELFKKSWSLMSGGAEGISPVPRLAEKLMIDIAELEAIQELFVQGRTEDGLGRLFSINYQTLKAAGDEKDTYSTFKKEFTAAREKGKELVKKLKEKFGGLSMQALKDELALVQPYIKELCALTEDFAQRYSAKKLAAGLMEFSDAEHYALDILADPDVCSEFKAKFDYIFVDEYQDSNYIQEELVKRISRGNNVFLVGDIKQSIYKFRLAEPEIFLAKYHRFRTDAEPNSRVIDLNKNYRSKPAVIDTINDIFRRLMTMRTVGLVYDDKAALAAGTPYNGPCSYEPRLCLIAQKSEEEDEADEQIEAFKAEELEAINAADLIQEYHGKMIAGKDGERRLEYRDIALLLRSAKSRGETYYKVLTDRGIPVYLERGEGYFDTPEIQVLLSLLRVIDDPRQDVALITVMHFPSFGFSAEELARIRVWGGDRRQSYYDALRSFALGPVDAQDGSSLAREQLRAKAAAFLEKLSGWRKKAGCVPLSDLVWELMHESGIASFAQALPGGQQRTANLRAMADQAETYESETAGGISGFVSYIGMISESKRVDTGQVKLLTEADDVVRIMTIHKSKGLEFPMVILAGMGIGLGGGPDRSPFKRHKDLGLSIKLSDPVRGIKATPMSFRIIDEKLKAEEFAEDIRVLYVALTRARDILVMSAASKDPRGVLSKRIYSTVGSAQCKNYLDMVLPALPMSMVKLISLESLTGAEEKERPGDDIRLGIENGFDIDENALPVGLDELKNRLAFRFEPAAEDLLKRKYTVSEIAESRRGKAATAMQAPKADPEWEHPARPKTGHLTGAEKGTAYHTVMEHLPFTPEGKDPASIAAFIEDLRQNHILTDAEAQAVEPERISAFFASDLGRRAVASGAVFKETPFVMKTDMDGRQVTVQGVIDCFFKEADGYVLVDYKSNYVDKSDPEGSAEHLRANYLPQLELYKEALEGICGYKVKESYLYLFGLDGSVRL